MAIDWSKITDPTEVSSIDDALEPGSMGETKLKIRAVAALEKMARAQTVLAQQAAAEEKWRLLLEMMRSMANGAPSDVVAAIGKLDRIIVPK